MKVEFTIKLSKEEIIELIERAKMVNHNIQLLEEMGLDGLDIADKFSQESILFYIAEEFCNWDPDGFWDLVYNDDLSAEEIYNIVMGPCLDDVM